MTSTNGIHHITAMAGDPQRNIDFYTMVLGQRLVKKTVNFDDPGTYHLYYGDYAGSPGTIMTFFPWPNARRGRRGSGEVGASAYRIATASLGFWQRRLTDHGVSWAAQRRFGEDLLVFPDPDGMMVELVASEAEPAVSYWPSGPLPEAHALRGFHSVTLWVRAVDETARVLTDLLGYVPAGEEGDRLRFEAPGPVGKIVDLLLRPELSRGQMGAGTVHHVAFRAAGDQEQLAWRAAVAADGFHVTEVKDRQYFRSIYFREPAGVLFEIATDDPGFAADEPVEGLGQALKLPPWLEPERAGIEGRLPRLTMAENPQTPPGG